ncbi:baseplate J/gp47 family protein [Achromobacter seleniivolatilans]|uniref:Baseplate J/gp47 family protein n=1 Tax=Achromobacter seleniivolatilans TaxID=3047478 RepID=A0ABY9MAR2_9BURK|nr:baseplate J/gp47 family protein [Achromobacter sp. R39]WMD23293.1 baseplate J/gp47 family protein [Achromobacter sp. R39]
MADYSFLENRGVIVADTAATRAQVEAEFRAVFGEDMPTDPATPQGQLITRITEERDAIARNNAELANQINPALSGGVFLDSLMALTGGRRRSSVRSLIVGAVLGGVPGTNVPAGSIAETQQGEQFQIVTTVVLDASGGGTANLRALQDGEIIVPPGGLSTVASSVLGWESITNPAAAIPGRREENDVLLRRRRAQTLALQTTSINEAIVARLYDIEGVRSCYYLENYADVDQTIDGIPLRKHSIWACVEGGTDQEVAQALFETKTVGGGYNGAVVVAVPDPINGRLYEVKFDRPTEVILLVRVTVRESTLDVQQLIPDLVMNYVDGDIDGDVSFVVGSDVSTFEIASAINQQEASIFVKKVELSVVGSGVWSSDSMDINPNQIARTQRSSIQVVIA